MRDHCAKVGAHETGRIAFRYLKVLLSSQNSQFYGLGVIWLFYYCYFYYKEDFIILSYPWIAYKLLWVQVSSLFHMQVDALVISLDYYKL